MKWTKLGKKVRSVRKVGLGLTCGNWRGCRWGELANAPREAGWASQNNQKKNERRGLFQVELKHNKGEV